MSHARVTRALVAAASATALLTLAACSTAATPSASGPASGATSAAVDDKCAAYKDYGDLKGKTVTIFTSIASDSEAKPHIDSYKPFEECTGATIKYEGSRDFEAQLPVRIKAGNAPKNGKREAPSSLTWIPRPLIRWLMNGCKP